MAEKHKDTLLRWGELAIAILLGAIGYGALRESVTRLRGDHDALAQSYQRKIEQVDDQRIKVEVQLERLGSAVEANSKQLEEANRNVKELTLAIINSKKP